MPRQNEKINNIYLLGFMSAGKTEAGRILAEKMKRSFFDSDGEIEKKEKMSVEAFIKSKGLKNFRKVESEIVEKLSKKKKIVAALGGGSVLCAENAGVLKATGITVYICRPEKVLAGRLARGAKGRPLIKGKSFEEILKKVEKLMAARKRHYEKADLKIKAGNLGNEKTAEKIYKMILKNGKFK